MRTRSPTVRRTKCLRILPDRWASTSCSLSSFTRNMVPGRTVEIVPSSSIGCSLLIHTDSVPSDWFFLAIIKTGSLLTVIWTVLLRAPACEDLQNPRSSKTVKSHIFSAQSKEVSRTAVPSVPFHADGGGGLLCSGLLLFRVVKIRTAGSRQRTRSFCQVPICCNLRPRNPQEAAV